MKINHILLISLLIVGALLVPAVSAEEIYNETYKEVGSDSISAFFNDDVDPLNDGPRGLVIYPVELFRGLNLTKVTGVVGDYPKSSGNNSDICDFTYEGEVIGTGECGYSCYRVDDVNYIKYWVTFDEISLPAGTGLRTINIVPKTKPAESVLPAVAKSQLSHPWSGSKYIAFSTASGKIVMQTNKGQRSTVYYTTEWSANLKLIKNESSTEIVLDSTGPTNIEVKRVSDNSLIYEKSSITSDSTGVLNSLFPIITDVYSPSFDRHYIATHYLNQPVEFRPYDTNGNVPLSGVQITVYTCDPVTFEPGSVVDTFTVDYGDIKSLPRGHYCVEASLNNYKQVYPISETRFSNVDGPAVALIPMEEVIEPNPPVEFRPYDTNGDIPLHGVQITVYTCDPVTFEPGSVVDTFTVDYGDIKSLPEGYYCIKASLNNYKQVYPISETRFSNVDGPAVALIPMEEVIEPNQPVEFQPFDINGDIPLKLVQITVYTCDPETFEPGSVVDIFTVDYGDIKSLPEGHYCIKASLNNYEQVYPISETRFSNVDGPAVALIPMKREEVIEPNQPVEFQPFDINWDIQLNGVKITVYTCDPETFEPGSVVDTFTVDYGDIKSLPRGHYCIEASLNNYKQVYPISETRFSNVDGPAVALIPMQYVGGESGSVEVRIVDVDTEEPLQNVRVRIYEALPNFQQGRLVKDVTVNSGDHISLPAGRYFAQATKSGYTQYFEVTNTRVEVDPPSPSILYIPMTSRDGITPEEGSFLDQSVEGIANLFGVSFGIGKLILGMLLALGIGTATAKHLRGGAQEFGLGMLGGVVLGVLIGLLPIWVLVLLVLIVGLWIGHRYMSGGDS